MVSIIVAADENNIIGRDNDLIWHLPDDLKHFKELTTGHAIIMGRKTFESIGKPLPDRTSIIITRNPDHQVEGCVTVHSLQEALNAVEDDKESFIIGGEQIYRLALPMADRVYLTRVHHQFDGDRVFPNLGRGWQEVSREAHPMDERHAYRFTFLTYERS